MKTTDPFEDLQLSASPKALFQGQSTDAKKLGYSSALSILETIVSNDYDLLKIVRKYLREKDALKDTSRINEIVETFNSYSKSVLERKLDSYKNGGGELSANTVLMVKKFFKQNSAPTKLEDAVKSFSMIIKDE